MKKEVERYERALHAVQSGVMMELQRDIAPAPEGEQKDVLNLIKHLRVGNNARACDHAALVGLMIAKGFITEDEYYKAVADEMEREVERYRQRLNLPYNVKLA